MSLAIATDALGALTVTHLAYTWIRLSTGTSRTTAAITAAAEDPDQLAADSLHRYLVLLPMLREERVAAASCAHFLSLVQSNPRVDVAVVTSRAESDDRAAAQQVIRSMARAGGGAVSGWRSSAALAIQPEALGKLDRAAAAADLATVEELLTQCQRLTTAEAIIPVIAGLNAQVGREAFHHLLVDAGATTKVAKLNAAVSTWFDSIGAEPNVTYIGVYDADSAPDLVTFHLIDRELASRQSHQQNPPEIFQQVSCYCRRLPALQGVKGIFALADAMAQTRWALGFEHPLYATYSQRVQRGRTRPLAYCVGHGCFVSSHFLRRIGGFPSHSPTDDLALGYFASAMGAEICAVPALDYCEVAPDPMTSMRQSRFWFSGSARFRRDLRIAYRDLGAQPTPWQRLRFVLEGCGRNAAWAGRGLVWLAAVLLAAVTDQWWLLATIVLASLAYVQLGYVQTIRAIRRLPYAPGATGIGQLSKTTVTLAGIAATPTFVLRSLGPLTGAIESIRRRRAQAWKHER